MQDRNRDILHRSRLDRLRSCFSKYHADAFLVTCLANLNYLTGFTGSNGLLIVGASRAIFLTDSRYAIQARQEISVARIRVVRKSLLHAAAGTLAHWGRRTRVAFSPEQLAVSQWRQLKDTSSRTIRWVEAPQAIETLRQVKEASEIAAIRDAGQLAGEVFGEVLPLIKPGLKELDLAAEIEYRMRHKGASKPAFQTIVASGVRSAWPHALPTSKPIQKNELVVLDLGAILRGYCSDLTRTVYLGKAPAAIRERYRAVQEAQGEGIAALRPGAAASAPDRAARLVLKRYRLEKFFTHSLGHGLGLDVHEPPRLARGETGVLRAGCVVTIEPGVYVEGEGGIRIEDDVLVTAEGPQLLTHAAREFPEL